MPAHSPLRWLRVGHVAGLLVLVAVAACLCLSDKTLRQWQQRQQPLVGIPELNMRLYDYLESRDGPAVIATDYQAMVWLPELQSRSIQCECGSLSAFRAAFDRPEVGFALIRQKTAATAVEDYLDGPAGRLVFEACGFRFYEKPHPPRLALGRNLRYAAK
jgi:hypothetical protein